MPSFDPGGGIGLGGTPINTFLDGFSNIFGGGGPFQPSIGSFGGGAGGGPIAPLGNSFSNFNSFSPDFGPSNSPGMLFNQSGMTSFRGRPNQGSSSTTSSSPLASTYNNMFMFGGPMGGSGWGQGGWGNGNWGGMQGAGGRSGGRGNNLANVPMGPFASSFNSIYRSPFSMPMSPFFYFG